MRLPTDQIQGGKVIVWQSRAHRVAFLGLSFLISEMGEGLQSVIRNSHDSRKFLQDNSCLGPKPSPLRQ
jgi:hypothetical protein